MAIAASARTAVESSRLLGLASGVMEYAGKVHGLTIQVLNHLEFNVASDPPSFLYETPEEMLQAASAALHKTLRLLEDAAHQLAPVDRPKPDTTKRLAQRAKRPAPEARREADGAE